jgi:hypothetical protein
MKQIRARSQRPPSSWHRGLTRAGEKHEVELQFQKSGSSLQDGQTPLKTNGSESESGSEPWYTSAGRKRVLGETWHVLGEDNTSSRGCFCCPCGLRFAGVKWHTVRWLFRWSKPVFGFRAPISGSWRRKHSKPLGQVFSNMYAGQQAYNYSRIWALDLPQ